MERKKVTSSDVAKRAGVSQATVSMVLNENPNPPAMLGRME